MVLSIRFPHQILVYTSPPVRATWPAPFVFLDFITWAILGEEYRSWRWMSCEMWRLVAQSMFPAVPTERNALSSGIGGWKRDYSSGPKRRDITSYPRRIEQKSAVEKNSNIANNHEAPHPVIFSSACSVSITFKTQNAECFLPHTCLLFT